MQHILLSKDQNLIVDLSFAELTLVQIGPDQSSKVFIDHLPYPSWFKVNFAPKFDAHRLITQGRIFLAISKTPASNDASSNSDPKVVGGIYTECQPHHLSYGQVMPIFGWLWGASSTIIQALLAKAEQYVKDHGFSKLRGPINVPKMYGGWGSMLEGYSPAPTLVDSAWSSKDQPIWIQEAGYQSEAEYIDVLVATPPPMENPLPHVEFFSLPIAELIANAELMQQLGQFTAKNFVGFLPDTSITQEEMALILRTLGEIPQGEMFYRLARDTQTNRIVGLVVEIPNLFELWQGKPITSVNVNSIITDKAYRGTPLFYYLYVNQFYRLLAHGITARIGGNVWTKNVPAMTAFSKIAKPIRKFAVFQKQW